MGLSLAGLNAPQLAAVKTMDGPLLLLAGAGTGKTRVVTYRIAYLIANGVAPANILAVTFTNKAAREMAERLAALVGTAVAKQVTASTFHSFCARLLRGRIRLLGYSPRFDIAAQSYQVGLVKSILGEVGLGDGDANLYHAMISRAKSRLLLPADLDGDDRGWPARFAAVYALYQRRMKNMDSLDFDDLLLLTVQLWKHHPEVLEECRDQYRYLLVDEYQDTNGVQFQLMAMLAGEQRNLCVVGDDDQSIYGWRGADVGNILAFDRHFPGAQVIRLEQNYRSTGTILKAANQVIANNSTRHAKQLWSAQPEGEKILVVHAADEQAEAHFIADLLAERTLGGRRKHADFAVLYRSNSQSRLFEATFRQRQIPYRLVGSKSFFQRREVLDALSHLKIVNNPKDDISLLRVVNVPPRGLGDRSIERLRELGLDGRRPLDGVLRTPEFLSTLGVETANQMRAFLAAVDTARTAIGVGEPLLTVTRRLLQEVGYLDGMARIYKPREDALRRLENVHDFFNAIAEYQDRTPNPSLPDFLERHALMDDNDRVDEQGANGVTLMTVHAAKGLEFPVVVIAGMEQGLFPHRQALAERANDEERRLFYVAITRARQELVVTHVAKRRVMGTPKAQRPSVFLLELPPELVLATTPNGALVPATKEQVDNILADFMAQFNPPAK